MAKTWLRPAIISPNPTQFPGHPGRETDCRIHSCLHLYESQQRKRSIQGGFDGLKVIVAVDVVVFCFWASSCRSCACCCSCSSCCCCCCCCSCCSCGSCCTCGSCCLFCCVLFLSLNLKSYGPHLSRVARRRKRQAFTCWSREHVSNPCLRAGSRQTHKNYSWQRKLATNRAFRPADFSIGGKAFPAYRHGKGFSMACGLQNTHRFVPSSAGEGGGTFMAETWHIRRSGFTHLGMDQTLVPWTPK